MAAKKTLFDFAEEMRNQPSTVGLNPKCTRGPTIKMRPDK